MRVRAVLAVAAAVGSIALTSCSSGDDPKAWADDFCGKIAPEVKKLTTPPQVDQSNPEQAKTNLSAYLDNAIGAVDNIVGAIDDAGDPPVDNGAEAVDKVSATMEKVKGAMERAKTAIDGADTSNPQAFGEAFQKAGQEMTSLGDLGDPTAGLKGSEEMNKAFNEAENCKALRPS